MTRASLILTAGNSYWLTRFVILRLLGFVYAVAFLIAAQQLVPLVGGEHGLTPATQFLSRVEMQFGSRVAGAVREPTLFWLGISDNGLSIFAWVHLVADCHRWLCQRDPDVDVMGDVHVDRPYRPKSGTATAGRFNCSRPVSCRSSFAHCLMGVLFPSADRRSWLSGCFAGSVFGS